MARIVGFFNGHFGIGGSIFTGLIFLQVAVRGLIIAIRGRQVLIVLVGFCAAAVGMLAGAMAGLLIFDSLIVMVIFAAIGAAALLLLIHYVRSVGYFISIFALSFFIAYVITSEMYITSTRITESTLLLADLLIGFIMGILAAVKSKYTVSAITSAAGGMISSISILALFGCYFADWKMWLISIAIASFGMYTQIKIYDLAKPSKKRK